MQDKLKRINALKAIFEKAKKMPEVIYEDGSDVLIYQSNEWKAIVEVGENKIYELKNEIYRYLEYTNKIFRAEAVFTLGLSDRLHLPEFKDKAYEIWLNDSADLLQERALRVWFGYYIYEKNPVILRKVLLILYKIVISDDYEIMVRIIALVGMLEISEDRKEKDCHVFLELYQAKYHHELEEKIDWQRVNNIIHQYTPSILEKDINKKFKYLQERKIDLTLEDKRRIKTLKAIFDKEKLILKTGDFYKDLESDFEVSQAIVDVGRKEYIDLKDEIYYYLKHENTDFRIEAVQTLGLAKRLQLPEFKDKAYEIWVNDSDNLVRASALQAWAGYYRNYQYPTELKKFLPILYKILIKHDYTIEQRVIALTGIIESVDCIDRIKLHNLSDLNNSTSHEILDEKIDWDRVNNTMREYAPDALREYPL